MNERAFYKTGSFWTGVGFFYVLYSFIIPYYPAVVIGIHMGYKSVKVCDTFEPTIVDEVQKRKVLKSLNYTSEEIEEEIEFDREYASFDTDRKIFCEDFSPGEIEKMNITPKQDSRRAWNGLFWCIGVFLLIKLLRYFEKGISLLFFLIEGILWNFG